MLKPGVAAALALLALGGCGFTGTADGADPATPVSAGPPSAQALLVEHATAARSQHYLATYTLSAPKQAPRWVKVGVAADGSWMVDVQGDALGGATSVTLVGQSSGIYQCTDTAPQCVRVTMPGQKLPATLDPQVQYPFTSWLKLLSDRQTPISVQVTGLLPGAGGTCFAIYPAVTAITPPIGAGTFCYTDAGTLTVAKVAFGTLTISGAPSPAPATIVLPGPITPILPLPTASPSPSPSLSGSASPSAPRTTRSVG